MLSKGGRAMNGSEMGTGKTATGVCICEYYLDLVPQLVICPSSLKKNWHREFIKFNCQPPDIIEKTTDRFKTRSVISYTLINTIQDELPRFKVIILDEFHYLKNRQAQRTMFITTLCRQAEKVILLSGTPHPRSNEYQTFLLYAPEAQSILFCPALL